MAGYRPKRRIYDLDFSDHPDPDMHGLRVKLRHVDTGQALALDAALEEGGDAGLKATLEILAAQLIEWNVEDDQGQPVPVGIDAVMAQEVDFNMTIVNAWREAIAGVPAPLDGASPDGGPSLEASIPMELPSESLAS
ncbi:hypothetical protein [Streptomyces silaceus]|uniref:hypothetical protein n=1 Tax=Streptomyces silaceus TaxID=545123 RepID=UPI0006EBAF72|nr:hypothetical protein [Streptomyces silaceus]